MSLERELETFQRELPNLLADGKRDKYVLIHGEKVVGVWDTEDQALEAGYDAFLMELFMAKKVTDHEETLYFSRNI
jgi:hypothetical protein